MKWVEAGRVPDPLVRMGIRRRVRRRLAESVTSCAATAREAHNAFLEELDRSPIALVPDAANEQHYEVSAAFFERVLGPHLKYSCGLWGAETRDIGAAEESMLALTCRRAQVQDGMRILDLGCGWGSFSLYAAERFPASPILAVSNSKSQREFILARAERRGLRNLEVQTADVNHFEAEGDFDRVVSVEMFEHVRNHGRLLERIDRWLSPGGKLFVHHFAHRSAAYPFEDASEDDWMARYFFTGGIMPSDDLLLHRQRHLLVERQWRVGGDHYQKTAEAWLKRQDQERDALLPILAEVYGEDHAAIWFQRWRLFFMACAELFGYSAGNEWWVTHVRMSKRGKP